LTDYKTIRAYFIYGLRALTFRRPVVGSFCFDAAEPRLNMTSFPPPIKLDAAAGPADIPALKLGIDGAVPNIPIPAMGAGEATEAPNPPTDDATPKVGAFALAEGAENENRLLLAGAAETTVGAGPKNDGVGVLIAGGPMPPGDCMLIPPALDIPNEGFEAVAPNEKPLDAGSAGFTEPNENGIAEAEAGGFSTTLGAPPKENPGTDDAGVPEAETGGIDAREEVKNPEDSELEKASGFSTTCLTATETDG
jgi:hypothetical protein